MNKNQTPTWRSRLGIRSQVVAGVLVAAVVLLVVGAVIQSGTYSPEGSVRAYFAALGRGDAARAWSLLEIAQPATKTDSSLLSEASFTAAVRAEHQSISGLSVGAATVRQDGASVPVAWPGHGQLSVGLRRAPGFYATSYLPIWRLVGSAPVLSLRLLAGSSGVAIDGQEVPVGTGSLAVALLPLRHQVTFAGGPLVQQQATEVDLLAGASLTGPVLTPKLTPTGVQKATQAISAALANCAKAIGRTPADCPQVGDPAFDAQQPTWELVGDPTPDLTFAADDQGQLVGIGHFQLILTAGSDPATAQHRAVGGAYSAVLSISGSDLKVSTIKPGVGVKPAIRPAGATDEAARQLVSTAFANCAAATVIAPAGCPQEDLNQSIGGRLENVRWQLAGDPLGNAQTTFDGDHSLLKVTGTFAMKVDYDFVDIGRIHHSDRSTNTRYEADLFWDGNALKLITMSGSL